MHEIKHDGYRLIVRRDGDTVRLFTRRGHDWTERYPAIAAAAAKLRARSFTLDGEAVVCGAAKALAALSTGDVLLVTTKAGQASKVVRGPSKRAGDHYRARGRLPIAGRCMGGHAGDDARCAIKASSAQAFTIDGEQG